MWRMACRHLAVQKKQTLLAVLVGSIGTALIISSYIFFSSFSYSGEQWLKDHFGKIVWQLNPAESHSAFTAADYEAISKELTSFPVELLPYSSSNVTVSNDKKAEDRRIDSDILALAFPFSAAANFEPEQSLWKEELSQDEVIISEPVAKSLRVGKGGIIHVSFEASKSLSFQVKEIAKEQGITGFRGIQQSAGSVIFHPSVLRQELHAQENSYQAILAGTNKGQNNGAFVTANDRFQAVNLKTESLNMIAGMKSQYGISFLFASSIAVIAGGLLLFQVLFMLADSRQELYGVLRTLGFSGRKIGRVFRSEAFLLLIGSALAGIAWGSLLGYLLVERVAKQYSATMERYEGVSIPIIPHLDPAGVVLTAALSFLLLALIVMYVSRKIRRKRILDLINGSSRHDKVYKLSPVVLSLSILAIGLLISGLLNGWAFELLRPEAGSGFPFKAMAVIALWICSSLGAIYLGFIAMPRLGKRVAFFLNYQSIDKSAILLGVKYPQLNFKRSFTVALLFSILFMALTSTLVVSNHLIAQAEVSEENHSLLGYTAYVPYQNKDEREKIGQILTSDQEISQRVNTIDSLEPYKLNIESDDLYSGGVLTILSGENLSTKYGHLPLSSRLPKFKDDDDVWKAMEERDDGIILDEKYALAPEAWAGIWRKEGLPKKQLKVGDRIKLNILNKQNQVATLEEIENLKKHPVDQRTFTILGFAQAHADYTFYNLAFVNIKWFNKYQANGFHWPNESLGYYVFRVNSADLKAIQDLRVRFLLHNINTFTVPDERSMVNQTINRQMVTLYISFMSLSLIIGVAGLSLIQSRAIQEREPELRMLRYIGLRRKAVRQIFFIEGTVIGGVGLLNGLIFGMIGSYIIVRMVQSYIKPTEPLALFKIPVLSLCFLSLAILVIILAVNYFAASKAGNIVSKPKRAVD